jgi:hypothetical protein
VKRIATILALAAAALAAQALPAVAQPASAIGQPLPDGKLAAGTVSVRVVAGSPSNPVIGTDVTLLVNGAPRVARTDSAGRATFAGIPVGAQVQAKVVDAENKDLSSESFAVPDAGGTRLMLSTKPFVGMGGGGGGPMGGGGGGGGMPNPRAMSGTARPDRDDPAGTYTVRVTYDEMKIEAGVATDPNPPVGTLVAMVGYAADDSVTVKVSPVDAKGLVHFSGLDQSGGTSYFALAQLPRNGGTDRLIAVPAILDGQQGARVVLSSEKRDSTAPLIDDYTKLVPADPFPTAAGKVRVTVDGVPTEANAVVTLMDAATMRPVGVTEAKRGAVDATNVRGSANFEYDAAVAAGALEVEVKGGPGSAANPIGDVDVQIITAADEKPIDGATAKTGADGKTRVVIRPMADVKAVLIVNGKPLVSAPLDLSRGGGKLIVEAQWPAEGRPEASFDVTVVPGTVLFAQVKMSGQLFRSLPFQAVADAGTRASVYVYPRTMFHFSLRSFMEDQLLAVQGSWEITNFAWAPYRAGPDGLLLPLPEGHKGGIVAPADQNDVAVSAGEGFRIMRPIPPGGRKFRAGFSLAIDQGDVSWTWPLPLGTWQSGMEIRQYPGMNVRLPAGVTGETRMATTGEPWFVIDNITIDRKKSMVLTITGLPAAAAWKLWAPRVVGILVLLTIFAGVTLAFMRKPVAAAADTEARRAKLMDELVELERAGKDNKRKEQILVELERMWGP